MNVLALCAGIGGLELGVKLANPAARCICYVEGEAYAVAILVKRMGEGRLDKAPVWSDVRTFDGLPWRGKVDCITAGYPCQPFSEAGQRQGEEDPRHLWPHIKRIVEEVQPTSCFFENVAGHLSLGFETVADDLQAMGYKVAAGLFTAEEVGATHERSRLFIMGHAPVCRWNVLPAENSRGDYFLYGDSWSESTTEVGRQSKFVAEWMDAREIFPFLPNDKRWITTKGVPQPAIFGASDGFPDKVDRVRACGNAVVPLVAAYAWRTLQRALQIQEGSKVSR
jgi:DNA (cytosine-5)-methyltransferase 1